MMKKVVQVIELHPESAPISEGGGILQHGDEWLGGGVVASSVEAPPLERPTSRRGVAALSIGRAQAKRTAAGTYTCQLADPVRPGQKMRVTASTLGEFEARVSSIQEVRRGLTLGMLSPEEARKRLGRLQTGTCTVDSLFALFRESSRKRWGKKAESVWNHRLAPYFSGKRAWELTEDVMRAWEAQELDCKLSRHTIANAFYVIKKSYRLGLARGLVDVIPWKEWHPKYPSKRGARREACRNVEELALLLHAGRERDERMRSLGRPQDACVLVKLLALTLSGLRQGEAAALGWDDLELEANVPTMHIKHAVQENWWRDNPQWPRPLDPPKTGVHDPIALNEDLILTLRSHRQALMRMGWYRPDGPVFPGRRGAWRRQPSVLDPETMRELVTAAGLPNVAKWVTHSTRHSYSTLEAAGAAANGIGLRSVMERTRHASMEVLEGYVHAAERGRVRSQIPSLLAAAGAVLPQPSDVGPAVGASLPSAVASRLLGAVASGGAGDLMLSVRRADAARDRPIVRHQPRMREGASFRELAREWTLAGFSGVPEQVTKDAAAAYERRRQQELRAKTPAELANLAARRSRHGVMMAWQKALKAAQTTGGANEAAPADGRGH